MDHARECSKSKSQMLMKNKVRLWKRMMFSFQTIGSNGNKPLSEFCNHEMQSQNDMINWSDIQINQPTKKEFRTWDKFVNHL